MASSSSLTTTTTTTTIINFYSNKLRHSSSHSLSLSSNFLHSTPRPFSPFRVSLANNKNPKFNFNLQNYNTNKNDDNEDDGDDGLDRRRRGRRTWKRRKKSDPKQRPWWYVQFDDDDDDDYEDDDERGMLVEVVDRLLVIKVFRSYGWFSPFILISLLLSTGPKAFLTAFSVFFGLSLLIFAFQKLQERLADSPKPQNTRRRRSKFGQRNDTFTEREADQNGQQSKRNKKRDYQSGAARNNGSFYANQNSNGASGNYFGGWDELVRDDETQRVHRSSQDNGRPKIMEEEGNKNEKEKEKEQEQEEKLSRSMQDGDLPLLLRLLVSIFPFLASWTNLL